MDISAEASLHELKVNLRKEKEVLECFKRLMLNSDFKKVILEGYLKDNALMLVLDKANPLSTPEQVATIEYKLNAIATFNRHLESLQVDASTIDARMLEAQEISN